MFILVYSSSPSITLVFFSIQRPSFKTWKLFLYSLLCRLLLFSLPPPLLLLNLGRCVATNVRSRVRQGRKWMSMTIMYWQIFFLNIKDQWLRIVILFFHFHTLTVRENSELFSQISYLCLQLECRWERPLFGLKA